MFNEPSSMVPIFSKYLYFLHQSTSQKLPFILNIAVSSWLIYTLKRLNINIATIKTGSICNSHIAVIPIIVMLKTEV